MKTVELLQICYSHGRKKSQRAKEGGEKDGTLLISLLS